MGMERTTGPRRLPSKGACRPGETSSRRLSRWRRAAGNSARGRRPSPPAPCPAGALLQDGERRRRRRRPRERGESLPWVFPPRERVRGRECPDRSLVDHGATFVKGGERISRRVSSLEVGCPRRPAYPRPPPPAAGSIPPVSFPSLAAGTQSCRAALGASRPPAPPPRPPATRCPRACQRESWQGSSGPRCPSSARSTPTLC